MSITMTPQQRKAKRKVIEALQGNSLGLSFGELMQTTGLSKSSLTKTLSVIDTVEENGLYILPFDQEISIANPNVNDGDDEMPVNEPTLINPNTGREYIEMPETGHTIKQAILAQIADSTPAKKFRNRPFTPNPITGYQVQKGKAKIFLDRKATSKTRTLSIDDLRELVSAVEKSERVA